MKRKVIILPFIIALTLLTSCRGDKITLPSWIPFVEKFLSNSESDEYVSLSGVKAEAGGVIAVIDEPAAAISLSKVFLSFDATDNVDGSETKDGLPDFAGEEIAVLADSGDAPYERYYAAGKEDELSELTVRTGLLALSDRCITDPFLPEQTSQRARAKAIVVGSPLMAARGLEDFRAILSGVGVDVPVLSPSEEMARKVLSSGKNVNVMIAVSEGNDWHGAQDEVFNRVAASVGDAVSKAVTLSAPDSADFLPALLDSYMASGSQRPLDAILVDDPDVPVDQMNNSLVRIMLEYSEENVRYRSVLADGFEIIDGRKEAALECCRLLREKSLFSHRVSYPESTLYIVEKGAGSLVEYNEKSDTDEIDMLLWERVLDIDEEYVQN